MNAQAKGPSVTSTKAPKKPIKKTIPSKYTPVDTPTAVALDAALLAAAGISLPALYDLILAAWDPGFEADDLVQFIGNGKEAAGLRKFCSDVIPMVRGAYRVLRQIDDATGRMLDVIQPLLVDKTLQK